MAVIQLMVMGKEQAETHSTTGTRRDGSMQRCAQRHEQAEMGTGKDVQNENAILGLS